MTYNKRSLVKTIGNFVQNVVYDKFGKETGDDWKSAARSMGVLNRYNSDGTRMGQVLPAAPLGYFGFKIWDKLK